MVAGIPGLKTPAPMGVSWECCGVEAKQISYSTQL